MESAAADRPFTDYDSSDLRTAVDRLLYRAQHYGLTASMALPGRLLNLLLAPRQERIDGAVLAALRQRYDALLDRDLDNVARGYYPRELLYQYPLLDYVRQLPEALVDLPRFLVRSYRGR